MVEWFAPSNQGSCNVSPTHSQNTRQTHRNAMTPWFEFHGGKSNNMNLCQQMLGNVESCLPTRKCSFAILACGNVRRMVYELSGSQQKKEAACGFN